MPNIERNILGECEINKLLLFSELENHSEQFLLGLIFYEGEIMEENLEKAFHWIKKSADRGYSKAQFYLGMMYFCGHGIEKDYYQSFSWLKKSAEQSHSEAEYYLSWHFKNGKCHGQGTLTFSDGSKYEGGMEGRGKTTK